MKTKCFTIIVILAINLLVACSPSPHTIQTAIAQTQAANPTSTFTYIPPTKTIPTTPTITLTPTITATPVPVVIYSDDFSNPQSGWDQMDSQGIKWTYSGGQYVLKDAWGWLRSCANRDFTNAVFTIDVIHISGDVKLTGPIIIWRYSDNGYYSLRITGGYLTIEKISGLDVSSQSLFDMTLNSAIKPEKQMNHIAISFDDGTSTIYINGIYITSFQDLTFLNGDICLGAFSTDQHPVEVAYDNLVVYKADTWTPSSEAIATINATETWTASSLYSLTKTKIPTKTPPPTKTPNLAQTSTAYQLAYLRADKPDGNYLVGDDISPGVWRNNGTGDCYWELTTRTGDIIKNYFGSGGGTAYIGTTAFAFRSEQCNTWTFLSPP